MAALTVEPLATSQGKGPSSVIVLPEGAPICVNPKKPTAAIIITTVPSTNHVVDVRSIV